MSLPRARDDRRNLRSRPIFHQLEARVEAQVFIAFLAYWTTASRFLVSHRLLIDPVYTLAWSMHCASFGPARC